MSESCVLPNWLKLQTQMYTNQKAIELKLLSETRLTAQIAAYHAVTSRLDVILALLEHTRDRAIEALSILGMI